MSDFGTDVGNSSLSMMSKLIEAILKLISKIFSTIMEKTGADYKLKKAEYKELKDRSAQRKFVEKIEGKSGYVKHSKLEKAGVPLTATGIRLDEKSFHELAEHCKREGIIISGVEDIRERELNGKKIMVVECRTSDLPKFAELIKVMNDNERINTINNEIGKMENRNREIEKEISDIKSGGRELNQEDLNRINGLENEIKINNLVVEELKKQIDDIRYGYSQDLNQEQAQEVVERAVNGESARGVKFDEALDRWTGGNIDKDTTCYIVDAKDPNRYIVCTAKNDTFHDKDYIKTTYEIYNGNKQVYATNDGRFEGRADDYWYSEKSAMRNAGGFSDRVIKFYSFKEVEAYRENFKAQNEKELDNLEVGKEGRNYDRIVKTLENKMDECGFSYKNGLVTDKETGKPVILKEDMSPVARANAAEACVVGKQIDNYRELAALERDVAIARSVVLTTDEGTAEHKVAQADFEKLENAYNKALDTEKILVNDRMDINGVQAEQNVSDMRRETEQVNSEVVKNVRNEEKRDERQDGRFAERDDARRTMDDYRKEINDRKHPDEVKNNDISGRDKGAVKGDMKQKSNKKGKEDR